MFNIDKNVPIPEPEKVRAGYRKYPLKNLHVGDSFEVPIPQHDTPDNFKKQRQIIMNTCFQYGKRHDKKFTVRGNRETQTVRVWRVA